MGTVPVAISNIDGGNNEFLISCEIAFSQARAGGGTVPDFFGRVCQSRKKAGTALAQQMRHVILSTYMRRGQSPFFAYHS